MNLKIPKFKNEQEEQAFWSKTDSSEYIEWKNAKPVTLPNLKLSTRAISIRLPVSLIDNLKMLAHRRDVPYQSLLKLILEKGISREISKNY